MKTYQAYILTFSGEVIQVISLACADEEAAKERAQHLVEGDPVELWDGPRRIARYNPKA